MMKKKALLVLTAGVLMLAAGCGNKAKTETTAAAAAETTAAAQTTAAETTAAAETEASQEAVRDEQTFKSANGWQCRYDASLVEAKEETDAAAFTYTGKAEGENGLKVSFVEGKQPEELLAEITESWGDQEKISRTEGFFPGASDKWAFWREMKAEDADGTARTAIAGEYNGGVLCFEFTTTPGGDEETDMQVSDVLAEVINSIEYEDFQPQEMYSYVPGTYTHTRTEEIGGTEITAEESIVLNPDHTGILSLQDNVDIIWGSKELTQADTPDYSWEYSIEGESLLLNLGGEWTTFEKQAVPAGAGLAKDYIPTTDIEGCDTFTQVVDKKLGDGQGYVNVPLDGTDVFMVSPSTYDGGDKKEAATEAELYIYKNDAIEYLGCIRTGGTANPLMISDGKLYAAGHHYAGKFTVKDGLLYILEEVTERFDADGNATYTYVSDENMNEVGNDEAKEIFNRLLDEYADGEVLEFSTVKR